MNISNLLLGCKVADWQQQRYVFGQGNCNMQIAATSLTNDGKQRRI